MTNAPTNPEAPKWFTFAVIAFVICALIASYSGSIVLKEFAKGTHPQRVAHPRALDCVILIVSSLAAITLPIIGVILGVGQRFGGSKG
jgi:hypothetical protein